MSHGALRTTGALDSPSRDPTGHNRRVASDGCVPTENGTWPKRLAIETFGEVRAFLLVAFSPIGGADVTAAGRVVTATVLCARAFQVTTHTTPTQKLHHTYIATTPTFTSQLYHNYTNVYIQHSQNTQAIR